MDSCPPFGYTEIVIQRGREQAEALGDKRVVHGAEREDQLDPFGRRSSHKDVKTKSTSQSALGSQRSWAMNLGGEPDLSKPYAQHPWIYACVSAISRASSSVPARIQRKLPNGEFETLPNSRLATLLETPNPLQSQRKFFRNLCTSQMLYGETFLILLKRNASGNMVPVEALGGAVGMMASIEEPEEIWPVRGDLVEPVLDEHSKLPIAWRFSTGSSYSTYPAHAVVQIAEVNPYNPLRGMGPLTAAYRTAAKDFVIDRYDEALLQNGGSPGGVLTVDGPLTDADQRAIRESWHEAHGRPESNRKTAVLPQGTEYKEIGLSPAQMEHEKLRAWDRQTILSIFGVPPVMLGLETMNYATSREQNRIFWETTVLPYLDFIKDEIQYKLIKRMRGEESTYLIDFDISGVSALREDMDSKVDRAVKLYEKGHRSFVEAAKLAGWNIDEVSIEGGDDRYVPVNLAPADQIGLDLDGPPPSGRDESKELTSGVCCEMEGEVRSPTAEPSLETASASWPSHLSTEEKRVSYWKLYTEQEDVAIEKVTKRTKAVYRSLLLSVRKRLREVASSSSARGVDGLTTKINPTDAEIERMLRLNVERWGEELAAKIEPLLKASMVSAAGGVAVEMGTSAFITSTTDPFILEFYKDYIPYLAELPNTTLAKDIRRTILRVLSEAELPSAITLPQAIRETLAAQEAGMTHLLGGLDTRADRIARTEVLKANNGARLQEMSLNKVERHIWLTSRDNSVRDEHKIMDGDEAIVGEPFKNGLRYPGDQAASAREVANCRCVTNAIIPPQTP